LQKTTQLLNNVDGIGILKLTDEDVLRHRLVKEIIKAFEVESILEKGSIGKHSGYIFYAMISRVYEALLHRIEGLKEEAINIESEIFKGKEKEMVMKISILSRCLLDFKRAISLHNEILTSFESVAIRFFGEDFRFHLRKLIGDYFKVDHSIKNTMEFISELRETNNALLTTKQNQITQRLTVIAFIALPLTIFTALLQIETNARPIIGHYTNDFWIMVGIEAVVAFAMYVFFKWKKWL
jgi:Mg2+ and Co2+ transporter CorA